MAGEKCGLETGPGSFDIEGRGLTAAHDHGRGLSIELHDTIDSGLELEGLPPTDQRRQVVAVIIEQGPRNLTRRAAAPDLEPSRCRSCLAREVLR